MFNLKSEIFNIYSNLENRFSWSGQCSEYSLWKISYKTNCVEVDVIGIQILMTQHLFAIEKLNQTLYLGGKHIFLSPEIGFFIQKEYWSGSYFTSRLVPALHVLQQKERELSVSLLLTRTLGDKQPKILVFGHLKSTHNLTWHCP